ncbi:MAG: DEAD/DEAH box helicase family protein, partial [Acidobacteriota bacterium]|nr:DEAD/DEAH box helicase family protein [Acidobacteriota bacterium]
IGKTQREALAAEQARKLKGQTGGGQFASGSVKLRLRREAEGRRMYHLQAFATEENAPTRTTLGKTAEQLAARVASQLAPNYDPRRPVKVINDVRMDGKYVAQQQGIKAVERMKRIGLHFPTGTGKTPTGLGAFAHLASQGKVKRGLFVVPPKQTGQWADEATTFMEPGRFRHYAGRSGAAEERRAAYADPNIHMVMVGHQALRDDLTWAVAKHYFDGDEMAARNALRKGPPANSTPQEREQYEQQQRRMVQEAARREGWNFEFSMIDEGHDALNRRGKPNSRLANVLDAITASHEYHVNATATPVKNDVSETFDLLHKLRPDRYPLSKRDEFLRRYDSGDIESVQEALRREVAPYFLPKSISTGVTRHNGVVPVQLSDRQKTRYREIHQAYLAAKRAKVGTPEHTEAVMRLFPRSQVEEMSPEQRTAAAAQSAKFLHSRRDAMLNRVVHGHDEELAPEDVAGFNAVLEVAKQHATDDFDGGQLPGVVFANNPGVVRKLADRMKREGLRVAVIDGTTSREEVDKIRQGFFPQGMHDPTDPAGSAAKIRQAAQYDIVVASNAASHGLNLQRAGWLYHIDDPSTAKTWQQRTGRADRIGALHPDVHVYTADYDAPYAKRRKRILREKTPITEAFQKDHSLLDQDETGTTQRIVERREENLGEALHAGLQGHGKPPAATREEPAEPTAAEEYAAQEAAGQTSMF